ncbi:MAG: queuosine precursor transporter [Gammaproteobacteria bacterium]
MTSVNVSPDARASAYRLLPIIAGVFVASLIITNTIDAKLFTIAGLTLTVGLIIFPLSYLAGDILTEVYGYAVSRRVIWTGFFCLALMIVVYTIAMYLPPSPAWQNESAFDTVFARVPRITIASMIAYFVGEFVNSYVVAKMKVATKGRFMGVRFIASTVVGQFFDTIVFVGIAFYGIIPNSVLPEVILSAWAVKVGWEVIALPLTLVVVRAIKKYEHEDHFDRSTNFSPFTLASK